MMIYGRRRRRSKASKISGIILFVIIVVTLFLITLGVYAQKVRMQKLREQCTASVSGICTDVTTRNMTRTVNRRRRRGSHYYKTQESYTEYVSHIVYTVDGKDYETTCVHEHNPRLKEGESITVFYDPADPSVHYVAG